MGSETPRTVRDPQATPTCPACGQPREKVAKRHKVLGAWVPEWEVQPCRNPRCKLYVRPGGGDAADDARDAVPDTAAGDGTEAATTHVTGKNGETGRSPATG
ncbi:hypothetical protein Q5762_07605 [Streptomyces sp. P9(2023)]|nr:hypothetical protein [Streptomyces sp. P9(2023)]MDT9688222.1 hypothetical protein [Streptomyces sp. P9(2023)]